VAGQHPAAARSASPIRRRRPLGGCSAARNRGLAAGPRPAPDPHRRKPPGSGQPRLPATRWAAALSTSPASMRSRPARTLVAETGDYCRARSPGTAGSPASAAPPAGVRRGTREADRRPGSLARLVMATPYQAPRSAATAVPQATGRGDGSAGHQRRTRRSVCPGDRAPGWLRPRITGLIWVRPRPWPARQTGCPLTDRARDLHVYPGGLIERDASMEGSPLARGAEQRFLSSPLAGWRTCRVAGI
jgi:hypothetical protein